MRKKQNGLAKSNSTGNNFQSNKKKSPIALVITIALSIIAVILVVTFSIILLNNALNPEKDTSTSQENTDNVITTHKSDDPDNPDIPVMPGKPDIVLTDEIRNAEVGDYITFGEYEQDNNTSNGKEPIEWLVLDKNGGKILVISKYGLDCQPYNEENKNTTWEKCTLRKWLNNDFLNDAFTQDDRSVIVTSTVTADTNSEDVDMNQGKDVSDKIFLLSVNEANKYLKYSDDLICEATEYAAANGVWISDDDYSNRCVYWLRSIGGFQHGASRVNLAGVDPYGIYVSNEEYAVRPALWITIK